MKTGQIAAVERVKRARSTYNHKFREKKHILEVIN